MGTFIVISSIIVAAIVQLKRYKLASELQFTTWAKRIMPNKGSLKRLSVLSVLCLFFVSPSAHAAVRYSVASGSWESTSSWSASSGGTAGASVPVLGDCVIIEGGFTITVSSNTAACDSVQVGGWASSSTGALNLASGGALNVVGVIRSGGASFGAITFANSSSLVAGKIVFGGTLSMAATQSGGSINMTAGGTLTTSKIEVNFVSGSTWNPGTGTVILNATNSLPSSVVSSFNHLTINSGTTNLGTHLNISGNLSIKSSSVLDDMKSYNLTGTAGGTLSIEANGLLLVGMTSFPASFGTNTFASNSTVNYYGNNQNVAVLNYSNLSVSGTGTKTLLGSIAPSGDLTIASSTLNLQGYTINRQTYGGTLSIASGATLMIGGTNSFPTNYAVADFASASNVTYNGTNQSIAVQAYSNLNIFNSGTKTLAGSISPTGNVWIQNSSFDLGSFTANRSILGGSFTVDNGASLIIGGTGSFPSNYTAPRTNANSTVIFNGTNQTIDKAAGYPYWNLTLAGSGVKKIDVYAKIDAILSMQGTATTSGVVPTYGSAATLQYMGASAQATGVEFPASWSGSGGIMIENANGVSLSASKNIGANPFKIGSLVANSIFNDGGYQLSSTGALNLSSGTFKLGSASASTSWPSFSSTSIAAGTTVEYASGLAQSVSGVPPYQNLTLSGAGTKNASGNIALAATLNNSTVMDMAAYTLSLGTSTTNSGTIRFSGATAFTNSSVNIGGAVEYYGSGGQAVTAGTYNNFTSSGGGTKTLAGACTVNGTLGLTNGKISIGANNLSLGTAASVSGTPSASNMVVADGSGKVMKSFAAGASSFTFPIGDNTGTAEYSPVTLNLTSNASAGTVGVRVVNTQHPMDESYTDYTKRYWSFTTSGLTNYTYVLSPTYVPADVVGTESHLKLDRYYTTTPAWYLDLSSTVNTSTHTLTSSPQDQTSPLHQSEFTGSLTTSVLYQTIADGDWGTASIWNTGAVPPTAAPVRINHTVVLSDAATHTQANLSVITGASLTISPSSAVTANGILKNAGTITIKSDASGTGNLVDNGIINQTGSTVVERYNKGNAFHYISSPLSATPASNMNDFGAKYPNPNFYSYNESLSDLSLNDDWLKGWVRESTAAPLTLAKGYALYYDADRTYLFTGGTPNTGTISIPLTYTTHTWSATSTAHERIADGWNLIGNPYPSSIDATKFVDGNSSAISGTLYFWGETSDYTKWDPDGKDYAAWNKLGSTNGTNSTTGNHSNMLSPNGYIAATQGFFVRAQAAGPLSVSFDNSMRTVSAPHFFKSEKIIQRAKISVCNPDKLYNETLIGFTDDATEGYDYGYDGQKMKGNKKLALYSILNNEDYTIQGLPSLELQDERVVSLGIDVAVPGTYKFNLCLLEKIDPSMHVYFIDKVLNKTLDLRSVSKYECKLASGSYRTRFKVVFTDKDLSSHPLSEQSNLKIYALAQQVVVELPTDQASNCLIRIFDVLGKQIFNGTYQDLYMINIPMDDKSGVFLVEVINNGHKETKKVLLMSSGLN